MLLQIIESEGRHGRVRNPVSRSNARCTFKIPSLKLGRVVECESELEVAQAMLLEADPSTLSYQEQPFNLKYRYGPKSRSHIPDFLAIKRDAKEIIEVKSDRDGEDPEILARTDFLQCHSPSLGYDYSLVTEADLKEGFALANARFLFDKTAFFLALEDEINVLNRLYELGPISLLDARSIDPSGLFVGGLCRLMLKGDLHYDPSQMLSWNTVITKV